MAFDIVHSTVDLFGLAPRAPVPQTPVAMLVPEIIGIVARRSPISNRLPPRSAPMIPGPSPGSVRLWDRCSSGEEASEETRAAQQLTFERAPTWRFRGSMQGYGEDLISYPHRSTFFDTRNK